MKKIGRYNIRALLGHGGMSKVYLVRRSIIGNFAALKLLAPHPSLLSILSRKEIRRQFTDEALLMANLRHPNIVGIQDFDEADGAPFYVMEYFSNNLGDLIGETYQTEAPSRILSVDKALHYIRQILSGVARLHHDGIIHRDIKPFNLLITEQDTVKICDFGLSKLRGEKTSSPDNLKIGSPFYAAPEQENAPDHVGFESDLFSVAVAFYRMLTGRLPYPESGAPLIPASQQNPDLDTYWDTFFAEALAPNPANRISDVKRMLEHIDFLAVRWTEKKEKTCFLGASPSTAARSENHRSAVREQDAGIRKTGEKIPPRLVKEKFDIDPLGRPITHCINRYKKLSDFLVLDENAGLIWQQAGSAYPITWNEARAYINQLNRFCYAGCEGWRLPTIPELITILSSPPHGADYCVPSVFDNTQRFVWSADRSSYTAAWYVNLEMGYVSKNDFSSLYSEGRLPSSYKALPLINLPSIDC